MHERHSVLNIKSGKLFRKCGKLALYASVDKVFECGII